MDIRWMAATNVADIEAASHLFDEAVQAELTATFLDQQNHHLAIAYVDDTPAGFVSGVEITHPDKRTEMFLYELGVDDSFRGRGVGKALVAALARPRRGARLPRHVGADRLRQRSRAGDVPVGRRRPSRPASLAGVDVLNPTAVTACSAMSSARATSSTTRRSRSATASTGPGGSAEPRRPSCDRRRPTKSRRCAYLPRPRRRHRAAGRQHRTGRRERAARRRDRAQPRAHDGDRGREQRRRTHHW